MPSSTTQLEKKHVVYILSSRPLKQPRLGKFIRTPSHRKMCAIAIITLCANPTNASDLTPYFDSYSDAEPKGGLGVSFQEMELRLIAGLNVEVRDGKPKPLPRISSAYTVGENFDIENSVNLPDWDSGIGFAGVALDTRLRLRSPARLVSLLDTRIRHLANGMSHDTTVHFRSPVSFLNQVQWRLRHSPNGESRYSVNLGFSRKLTEASAELPFTVRVKATLETMSRPRRADTTIFAMETTITDLIPRFLDGLSRWRSTSSNTLVLRFKRKTGGQESQATSLAYDHSWTFRETSEIELSLKVSRTSYSASSSVDVSWQSQF